MEEIRDRVKIIRKSLKLTQQEFADRIGMAKISVSSIEYGKSGMSDRTIQIICKEFGINEEWLRTGEGEMMKELDREGEIAKITDKMLNEVEPSIRNRLHKIVSQMTDSELEIFYKYAKQLVEEMEENNPPS